MTQRSTIFVNASTEHLRPGRSGVARIVWLIALFSTLAVLVYGFIVALFLSPTEGDMGNIARAIYYHVPTAMLCYLWAYINLGASVAFLIQRRRNPLSALAADALAVAAAEVTIVYASLTLITGSVWGKIAWGIWWTWDARLTLELLLWLLYVAYLITRRLSATGQTSTLSAVFAIFAAVDVPINYFAIRTWKVAGKVVYEARTQHPQPVFGGDPGSGLDSSMMPAFLWNLLAWAMWGAVILTFRYALERRRQIAEQNQALRAIETSLHTGESNAS